MDEREFMRRLGELVRAGKDCGGTLGKERVEDFCRDMSLSGEQTELVYAYLAESNIHVPGTGQEKSRTTDDVTVQNGADEGRDMPKDSKYLSVYRRELRELPEYTKEDVEEFYDRLRGGDGTAVPLVIESHLKMVVSIAGKYRGRGVPLEDLIQEGNLELITCVSGLNGNREVADFKRAIDHAVRGRLIELVDAELEDSDSVSKILARMNLLLEATRFLAEEYGRVATIQELSEFTKMDEEEIQMYVDFSRKGIELGSGESYIPAGGN